MHPRMYVCRCSYLWLPVYIDVFIGVASSADLRTFVFGRTWATVAPQACRARLR